MLGTEDDFKKLCSKAHELGIKVILDGVFSHTGSNSIYFDSEGIFQNGAVSNENSPYKSWYDFDDYPVSYTSWWGIKTLPCVNEMDPSYLNYILYDEDSVVKYWLSLGADGFRLDVADELPDVFISELRKTVKAIKPQALVLGEVWEDASNKVSYNVQRRYFSGGELDSVMNYPFYKAIVEFVNGGHRAAAFQSAVMAIAENYPKHVLDCVMNSLSTHDTVRILTLLGDNFQGSKQEKAGRFLDDAQMTAAVNKECAAAALQFTLPGMACIFYGDEAGLEGFEDPFNRRFYPWGRENQELLSFYREISTIKAEKPVYRDGRIEFEDINENTVCFSRCRGSQRIYTAVNAGENPVTLAFTGKVLLMRHGAIAKNQATLAAFGIVIWEASE